jgi:hypothetical protein
MAATKTYVIRDGVEGPLEAITDAVLEAGLASNAELNATVDDLYAVVKLEGTGVSGPRVVRVWGRRA